MGDIRNRMRLFCAIFVLCLLASGGAKGIQLQPAPVQDALDASLALLGSDDDFGTLNTDKQEEPAANDDGYSGNKSVWKAGLLSALVPGGGEFYLGNRKKARYFFAAEVLTWIGYASFQVYGHWKEDDYVRYAAVHAGVQIEGRDDDFRDAVGFYNNLDEYNTIGRIFDQEREYIPDVPQNHWQWQAEQERLTYRQLKNSSRESLRRSDFMIGVAIVDRIISIVDAVRDGRKMKRNIGKSFSATDSRKLKLSVNPFRKKNQIKLTLATNF